MLFLRLTTHRRWDGGAWFFNLLNMLQRDKLSKFERLLSARRGAVSSGLDLASPIYMTGRWDSIRCYEDLIPGLPDPS